MHPVIRHYRTLHQFPEVSGQEFQTSQYIAQQLREAGLHPVPMGKTSLMADICFDPALPWIVFRADMDALPIPENSGLPFASQNCGVMHACGHDGHSAMLLCAAQALAGRQLPQNVRFLFQCAEETTMGAAELIALDAIPKNTLAAFAFHIWPGLTEGVIATTDGPMMASGDVFRITFRGESMHCAVRPTAGDTLRAAVELAHRMPQIEALTHNDGSLVFCGSIHSGTSHNIVPDTASIYGTIRTYNEASRQTLLSAVEENMQAIADAMNVTATLAWEGGCPMIRNDASLIRKLEGLFPQLQTTLTASLTGEDFGCYQRICPGVLLWLGNGPSKPLHHEAFRISESILETGVDAWVKIAARDWT